MKKIILILLLFSAPLLAQHIPTAKELERHLFVLDMKLFDIAIPLAAYIEGIEHFTHIQILQYGDSIKILDSKISKARTKAEKYNLIDERIDKKFMSIKHVLEDT